MDDVTERAEARFKAVVAAFVENGAYPTPTLLNLALSGRRSRHLGGCRPRWRKEVFAALGVELMRRPPPSWGDE